MNAIRPIPLSGVGVFGVRVRPVWAILPKVNEATSPPMWPLVATGVATYTLSPKPEPY